MNKYTVSEFLYFSMVMNELFADYQAIREKAYSDILSILRVNYTDVIINPRALALEDWEYDDMSLMAGVIKDLVSWSDQDLDKVEQYALTNGADLDKTIAEVIA
jgi:hypothetical protein